MRRVVLFIHSLLATIIWFIITFSPTLAQTLHLEYSTYLGGSSDDRAHGLAIDRQGNVIVTAPIQSTNFPTTPDALKTTATGIYVAKMSTTGDSLLFSTYLGASGGANYAHGVAVDNDGYIYIAGNTTNASFPTTEGAFDRTYNGTSGTDSHGDAFVVKLNPQGNEIIYSTFIGGSGMDICGKIVVDAEGCAYILGSTSSQNFPVTNGAFDTSFNGGNSDGRDDIFVAKLNANGSDLIYCTYMGGSATELYGDNILIDEAGCVYFAATTASPDFPVTNDSYDPSYNGGSGVRGAGDGIVVKFNASGSAIEYATFIGGSGDDFAFCIARDETGNIYVGGLSASVDFPIAPIAFSHDMQMSGFLAKLNAQLDQLLYASRWDGTPRGIAIHSSSNVLLIGMTESIQFPVTPDANNVSYGGNSDICLSVFDPTGTVLKYSTYFGGSGQEYGVMALNKHNLYIAGNTTSRDFPISQCAYDTSYNGGNTPWGGDAFIAKFSWSDSLTSIDKSGFHKPKQFNLPQNYPNPFNPETTICYSLEHPSPFKLTIYNLRGQEVRTLENSHQNAGNYSLTWDATDENNSPVSSGIYMCRLKANAAILYNKMLLIR
ncbi:SBBP repeat-containing protein [candidate division KSB1 bacterium]|nr:SBBP repeat-containing protein [candidate division KSB1 bacterium]